MQKVLGKIEKIVLRKEKQRLPTQSEYKTSFVKDNQLYQFKVEYSCLGSSLEEKCLDLTKDQKTGMTQQRQQHEKGKQCLYEQEDKVILLGLGKPSSQISCLSWGNLGNFFLPPSSVFQRIVEQMKRVQRINKSVQKHVLCAEIGRFNSTQTRKEKTEGLNGISLQTWKSQQEGNNLFSTQQVFKELAN